MVHTLLKWLDHNRYKAVAVLFVFVIMGWGVGYESRTMSLITAGAEVTRAGFKTEVLEVHADLNVQKIELEASIARYNAAVKLANERIAAGRNDLEHKDEIKAKLFSLVGSALTGWATGGVPVEALIATGLTALGLIGGFGAYADGRRKDGVIAELKKPDKPV